MRKGLCGLGFVLSALIGGSAMAQDEAVVGTDIEWSTHDLGEGWWAICETTTDWAVVAGEDAVASYEEASAVCLTFNDTTNEFFMAGGEAVALTETTLDDDGDVTLDELVLYIDAADDEEAVEGE